MSTEQKVAASFDEILGANDTKYDYVDAYGKTLRIGSLNSADMIEWLESNDDPAKKRFAGLRLLVKSLVNEAGDRLPGVGEPAKFEEYVKQFSNKDAKANGTVVQAVLKLNGLIKPEVVAAALKNDSSETSTGVSPTDSPLKLVERT